MIIQSRMQPPRVAASNTWTDDEGDDDPWSGYGDTLEMELTPTAATTNTSAGEETYAPTAQATIDQPIAYEEPENEFAAAAGRLHQRGHDLLQQHVRQTARRQNPVPHYFPHLEQNLGFGHGGRGYAPSPYYTPAPTQVRYTPPPPPPVHHAPAVPQVIQVEPDPQTPPQGLPYEIDAYGNPILPEGMELDAWGNLVPDNAYYRNY